MSDSHRPVDIKNLVFLMSLMRGEILFRDFMF